MSTKNMLNVFRKGRMKISNIFCCTCHSCTFKSLTSLSNHAKASATFSRFIKKCLDKQRSQHTMKQEDTSIFVLKYICMIGCHNCLIYFRSDRIRHLLHPHNTVLDDSIGCALWFAARGTGILGTGPSKGQSYTSKAKVCIEISARGCQNWES